MVLLEELRHVLARAGHDNRHATGVEVQVGCDVEDPSPVHGPGVVEGRVLRDLAHGNAAPRPLPLTPGQLTLRAPLHLHHPVDLEEAEAGGTG